MDNIELEKRTLIYRYNELRELVKPIIGETKAERLFNKSIENYDSEKIKEIIVIILKNIGSMVSSGVFLLILLDYKDLIESNDPVKVMNLTRRAKKEHSIVLN